MSVPVPPSRRGLVEVLLSTYNGGRFLGELLDSVLAQDHADVQITARDDGSGDGTLDVLRQHAAPTGRVRVEAGEHVGFVFSFLRLLAGASGDADYFAFCDQDDVWLPQKMSRAVTALGGVDPSVPALYCSAVQAVTRTLAPLRRSRRPARGLSFRNALVECPLLGCTFVWNRPAQQLLARAWPRRPYSHDWWVYLVVSGFGVVLYDDEPQLLHRRHDRNASRVFEVLPKPSVPLPLRIRRFLSVGREQPVVRQAEELARLYARDLPPDRAAVLGQFLGARRELGRRLVYLLNGDVYRQAFADHVIMKTLFAIERL